jgi:hypothetical protein
VRTRAGSAPKELTPLALRTYGTSVDEVTREHVRRRLARNLGTLATRIERLTVRFTDVNGPRGGVDTECALKVVLSGHRSVVYRMRGHEPRETFDRAVPGLVRAVRAAVERVQQADTAARSAPRRPSRRPARGATAPARLGHPSPEGSFIGRRVGRSARNLELALGRPEKLRRDFPVDTAAPGVSATHRRAGGGSTARRNAKKVARRATATLEDSARDRPSRKSTRKSANRAKQGSKLRRRKVQKVRSPSARAAKAQAR